MSYQEIQALGFPNSPRKLGLYEKPWAFISWYGPCTQLVNSSHCQEKLIFSLAQEKKEFLLPLCTKFIYNVYINSFLKALSDHCSAISINSVSLSSPSFGDDNSLLTLYPSFLETFMNICRKYGIKWRYEFKHTKSGVVTFGETKPLHTKSLKERGWMLGDAIVNELYKYKNLEVLKIM